MMHYAEYTAGLPEGKWEAIKNILTELVGIDARSDDEGFNNTMMMTMTMMILYLWILH
jgi:hypothetical protein